MSVQRFVQKYPRIKGAVAARYEFGQSLDDLLSVARRIDADASMVEIPAWRALSFLRGALDTVAAANRGAALAQTVLRG